MVIARLAEWSDLMSVIGIEEDNYAEEATQARGGQREAALVNKPTNKAAL